jgi:hypothetical protein
VGRKQRGKSSAPGAPIAGELRNGKTGLSAGGRVVESRRYRLKSCKCRLSSRQRQETIWEPPDAADTRTAANDEGLLRHRDDASIAVEKHLGNGQLKPFADFLREATLTPVRRVRSVHGEDQRVRREICESISDSLNWVFIADATPGSRLAGGVDASNDRVYSLVSGARRCVDIRCPRLEPRRQRRRNDAYLLCLEDLAPNHLRDAGRPVCNGLVGDDKNALCGHCAQLACVASHDPTPVSGRRPSRAKAREAV